MFADCRYSLFWLEAWYMAKEGTSSGTSSLLGNMFHISTWFCMVFLYSSPASPAGWQWWHVVMPCSLADPPRHPLTDDLRLHSWRVLTWFVYVWIVTLCHHYYIMSYYVMLCHLVKYLGLGCCCSLTWPVPARAMLQPAVFAAADPLLSAPRRHRSSVVQSA